MKEQRKSSDIQIKDSALDREACYEFVQDPSCGGICIFVGTVRNQTQGKRVTKLEFSAYIPMAIKEMQRIADRALEDFGIFRIAIHHAVGELGIGEVPVIIAVSSPHRREAFEACQFAIDRLKETVPIWKKEYFDGGEIWVNAHP